MPPLKYILLSIFSLGTFLEIAAPIFGWPVNHILAKPLIMFGLMGYYYLQSVKRSSVFILALAFCWAGDVLLLFESYNGLFFMGGLVSFLIGHVLYIVCYRQFQSGDRTNELMGPQKVRFSLPFILAGTGLVVILFPVLGHLKIPVMVYALVLTLMVLNALFRYGRTSTQSFLLIFLGAILFMVSDSVLAMNKFLQPFRGAGALIMITYCAAQFLIVKGILTHEKCGDN